MRALATAAVVWALLAAPSLAQGVSGSDGNSSPDNGSGQKAGHGKRSPASAQKSEQQTPKADEKAYRSALDRMPDQKFDPWRNVRGSPGGDDTWGALGFPDGSRNAERQPQPPGSQ